MADQKKTATDKQVGKWVRKRRQELGLTQAQLAGRLEELGLALDPTGITRIEQGSRSLRLPEARLVAVALASSLWQVVEAVETTKPLPALVGEVLTKREAAVAALVSMERARHQLALAAEELDADGLAEMGDAMLGELGKALGSYSDWQYMMEEVAIAITESRWDAKRAEILGEMERLDRHRRDVSDALRETVHGPALGSDPYTENGKPSGMPTNVDLLGRI